MRGRSETIFYLAVGAGMALSTSAFTMVGGLFQVVPLLWALVGIAVAGAFCAAIALSIGELASLWPSAPAIRTYFKMAFNDRTSLIFVYLYLAFIILIAGVESYMFALVVKAMFPAMPALATVTLLLAAVVGANIMGADLPRQMQVVTTFGCVAMVVGVGAVGVFAGGPVGNSAAAPSFDGLAELPAAVGLAIFLFIGFEWITPVGLRPASYERQIPYAMLGSVLILVVTYMAFAAGLGFVLTRADVAVAPTPQVPYLLALFGPKGVWIAGVLSLTAIFSTFNAGLMGGARLLQAMARESTLPKSVGSVHLRTGAPVAAALLLGGCSLCASIVIVSFELHLLAAVVGAVVICGIYAAYMFAVLRLRRLQPDLHRPFRTPLSIWLQWVVALLLLFIGLATLFSIAEFGATPSVGVLACLVAAVALAEWSLRRRVAAGTRQPSRPTTRRSGHA